MRKQCSCRRSAVVGRCGWCARPGKRDKSRQKSETSSRRSLAVSEAVRFPWVRGARSLDSIVGRSKANPRPLYLGGNIVQDTDIGNPVLAPARQTRIYILIAEARSGSTQPRGIEVFEGIDVDDGVEMAGNLAGDNRHRAATGADVKGSSLRAEHIL